MQQLGYSKTVLFIYCKLSSRHFVETQKYCIFMSKMSGSESLWPYPRCIFPGFFHHYMIMVSLINSMCNMYLAGSESFRRATTGPRCGIRTWCFSGIFLCECIYVYMYVWTEYTWSSQKNTYTHFCVYVCMYVCIYTHFSTLLLSRL
jgi:hypothetical protein